jgi:hypothetical protein
MTLKEEILSRGDCTEHIQTKNCQAIANLLSNGRVSYQSTMITERGVRAALGVSAASQFLRLLKECEEAVGVPTWLGPVLTSFGIPSGSHIDYAEALGSAYGWLRQGAGIDVGSAATRGMLDIIAASDSAKFGATVATLKALALIPNPVSAMQVANALFDDFGNLK